MPVVALVGYTNSGKSTLLNRMTGAEILAEDKLFATLDPTTRKLALSAGSEVRGSYPAAAYTFLGGHAIPGRSCNTSLKPLACACM